MPTAINFNKSPPTYPKNAPNACRVASRNCDPESNPPANAPTNGPKIMPNGPPKKPTIKPMVAPQTTFLLPPILFVPHTGKTLSKIVINKARTPSTIIVVHEISFCTKGTNFKTSKPAQHKGTPGKIGAIVPMTPAIIKITAIRIYNEASIKLIFAIAMRMFFEYSMRQIAVSDYFDGASGISSLQPIG